MRISLEFCRVFAAVWSSRRAICICVALALSIVLTAAAVGEEAGSLGKTSGRTPNIIFILADDLGYGDLGCYGQARIKTPHLDRMAAEGLRFTDAYAGGPVCAPSRCVLMTGRHVGHARVRGNIPAVDPGAALLPDDVTVARLLHDAGYATGIIGKWGLGEPTKNAHGLPRRHGFDYFFGYLKHGHAHNYYTDHLWRNESTVKLPNVISKNPAHRNNVAETKVAYTHDLFADEGLAFVRNHKDAPFFLYWALTIPHANNEAGNRGMEVPDYGPYAEVDWPDPQKAHAAMITRMDRDIGRMFALLSELGIDDETIVVFSSDNGPHREGGFDPDFNDSNGPLRGYKGDMYDGGIRVPLIARWPGRVPAGTTSQSPVSFADILPTFANLANTEVPEPIDGHDITPTLLGGEQPELADRFLYWEFYKNGVRSQAARWRNWKAVRTARQSTVQLYDLTTDTGESHDLAKQHAEIATKLGDFMRTARTDSPIWPEKQARSRADQTATTVQ